MMIKETILTMSVVVVFIAAGCGANEGILKSGKETPVQPSTESKKSAFEEDLISVKAAGFSSIFILRRKDGAAIDADDRSVIRLETAQANRRVSTDDGKAVIIGSNFQLSERNMKSLNDRFAIEDLSPPATPAANSNANANANK